MRKIPNSYSSYIKVRESTYIWVKLIQSLVKAIVGIILMYPQTISNVPTYPTTTTGLRLRESVPFDSPPRIKRITSLPGAIVMSKPPPPITFELDSSFEKSSDPSSIPRVVRISPSPTSTAGAYGRSPSPRRTFGIKTSKDRGRTRPRTTRAMTTCPTQNPNIWSGSFLTALKEGYAKLVRIARMGAEMYRRTGAQK